MIFYMTVVMCQASTKNTVSSIFVSWLSCVCTHFPLHHSMHALIKQCHDICLAVGSCLFYYIGGWRHSDYKPSVVNMCVCLCDLPWARGKCDVNMVDKNVNACLTFDWIAFCAYGTHNTNASSYQTMWRVVLKWKWFWRRNAQTQNR